MENAADALIMAGAVFVLVIILTVTAFAFSNARQSLDNITALTDKESLTVQGNENYYYLSTENNSNTSRNVGMETIIPAIHRAFYENYKIQFDFSNKEHFYLYKDKDGNEINTIDLDSDLNALNNKQREDFINAILYHTYNGSNSLFDFNANLKKSLGDKIKINDDIEGLIKYVGNSTFEEKLGVYYFEDANSKEENIKEYGDTYRKYYF